MATQASNAVPKALSAGMKRKRIVDRLDESALGASFIIKGHSVSVDDSGITLSPLSLIPRSSLPLSFLAPCQGDESIPRIFRGNVKPLEATDQQSLFRTAPNVLIARKESSEHALYAIERVAKGVYALCELASWVHLDDFEGPIHWLKGVRGSTKHFGSGCFGGVQGIEKPCLLEKTKGSPYDKIACAQKVRLSMKPYYESTSKEYGPSTPLPPDEPTNSAEPHEQNPQATCREDPQCGDPVPTVNLEGVLENLKRQYMETLYNSRSSLAYFAKGPLTRPRGLLLQENNLKPSCQEVCQGLRSCILSRNTLDLKYSSTVHDFVKDLPFDILFGEAECDAGDRSKTKPSKSKKRKKLGKNGLFPGEEEYIQKWYTRAVREQADDCQIRSREERGKAAIAGQRSRETQIQIMLILEIIALELSPPTATSIDSGVLSEAVSQAAPMAKSKKLQNLPELVDVLVERLCIWQSTDLDLGEQPKEQSKVALQHDQPSSSSCNSSNGFEDFCTQVIVPFYAARLPDLSAAICRKLGVSVGPSPKRPVLARSLSKSKRKDTEASQDKLMKRRKTLERVLTDDRLTRQGSVASLVRSNTDSAIPRIKREASEVALNEVPATKGIKAMPRQYSQREIDLTAVSRAAEARLQRKQLIEQEKNAAIALLKKPNARMAVLDLLESKDQREAEAKARSRKPKNPVRNIFAQGVQVTATPQTNRHKDVSHPLPKLMPPHFEPSLEPEAIPPSSDPKIPASSVKANLGDGSRSQETPVQRREAGALRISAMNSGFLAPPCHDTPVRRRSAIQMPRVALAVVKGNARLVSGSAETPSRGHDGKTASVAQWQAAFSKPGSSRTPSRKAAGRGISGTPSSKRMGEKVVVSTPSKGEKSIYESLGWDHDDVDDLI